jgi:tetratricopeptide (TPR) repeat protein
VSVAARRYYVRGRQALADGEIEAAMESLRSAVDLAPSFADARIAYAVALARFGDGPRAAQALRSGIGRRTSQVTSAALWATLGDVLTQSGDFLGAEEAFRQAATHPSFAARADAGLARVHAKLGRYADAFACLGRTVTAIRRGVG